MFAEFFFFNFQLFPSASATSISWYARQHSLQGFVAHDGSTSTSLFRFFISLPKQYFLSSFLLAAAPIPQAFYGVPQGRILLPFLFPRQSAHKKRKSQLKSTDLPRWRVFERASKPRAEKTANAGNRACATYRSHATSAEPMAGRAAGLRGSHAFMRGSEGPQLRCVRCTKR